MKKTVLSLVVAGATLFAASAHAGSAPKGAFSWGGSSEAVTSFSADRGGHSAASYTITQSVGGNAWSQNWGGGSSQAMGGDSRAGTFFSADRGGNASVDHAITQSWGGRGSAWNNNGWFW